jgi:hypothetical protein
VNDPVLIHADEVAPQPWRNGGGQTRELLTWPTGARTWELRISLAQVTRDGPFSVYPGIQRCFTVIDGAGVRLMLDGHEHRLETGSAALNFSGALPVFCTLIDGPTTDLNLMHSGGQGSMVAAQSGLPWISALPQRGVFTRTAGLWSAGPGGGGAGVVGAISLPARCLLWLEDAAQQSWTFVAGSPAVTPPALWLGFAPRAAVYHAHARIPA